jgi:nicotinamide-nucleotide amidase
MTVSTAESCTGGSIAQLLTSISGASHYFLGGIVAYSNDVKMQELGVNLNTLEAFGAVSEAVVIEMAEGARQKFRTDFAISVSGIAGPEGGTADKPVGTVWIAVAGPRGTQAKMYQFGDNRKRNIERSSLTALNMLRKQILSL